MAGTCSATTIACRCTATCTGAILNHQPQMIGGQLSLIDVDFETGRRINWEQDELRSPSTAASSRKGGDVEEGAAYTRSWAEVQHHYGVLPEDIDVSTGAVLSPTEFAATRACRRRL